MFTRNLESKMNYIQMNQECVRREDVELMGVEVVSDAENIYLPASFLGSQCWASEQVNDCLAIAAKLGNPTFFVTMTCNPNWPKIQSQLMPGQDFTDIPIIVAQVFHQKLSLLLKDLRTMFPNGGRQLYSICSIEFQKHGLPHAHILIKYEKDCLNTHDIDQVVSTELPDNKADRELVQ
jgi:Helitron helicase-like domain at N-terminus